MDLGLIQRQVATQIGADKMTVNYWETGRVEPGLRFLPAILAFLGYDPRLEAKTVGERLVAFREGKGWARPRLARELQVDPSTLARWERGKREPWGIYAKRVAALLGGG